MTAASETPETKPATTSNTPSEERRAIGTAAGAHALHDDTPI